MELRCFGENIKGREKVFRGNAGQASRQTSGQAALIAVALMLFSMMALIAAASTLALSESKIAELNYQSNRSYFLAESGLEDALYRLMRGKPTPASYSLSLYGESAAINVSDAGGQKHITSAANLSGMERAGKIKLINALGASFRYGAQVGYLGLEMKNHAKIIGSVYSNGSIDMENQASITGDAWVAGGTASTPNQEQTSQTSDLNVRDVSSRRDAAQSFVPTITAEPRKIALYIKRTALAPSDASVRIVADENGRPEDGNAIANGNLNASNVTTNYGWVEVTFNSAGLLTQGTTYWLVMDNSSDNASRYYIWGGNPEADADGNNYVPGTFKYSPDWSNNSPTWTSAAYDAVFKIYVGETNTFIEGGTVGQGGVGDAHAHTIRDSAIAHDAYYQTISNTTVGGTQYSGSSNPAPQNFPISQAQIDQFKADGDAGGACVMKQNPNPIANPIECDLDGDYTLDGTLVAITTGPIRIPGNLKIKNSATLNMGGTIHVGGKLDLGNDCTIKLSSSYGSLSGVIVVDGTVEIENKCDLLGSGDPQSYFMILTTSPQISGPAAIKLKNHASSAILYASEGAIQMGNQSGLKEAVGQKLILENEATVTYETGLQNVNFSSGPSGGWEINGWEEIVP